MTSPAPDARLTRYADIGPGQTVDLAAPGDIPFAGTIGAAVTVPTERTPRTGLLVMIHGLGSDWDEHDALSLRWSDRFDVVVVQVRHRQSGAAGLEAPCDLGKHQAIDCLRATLWARERFEVEPERVHVWGGSGGAHIALMCLIHGRHLFAGGVAIAPFTHPTMPGEIMSPEWVDGWMHHCIPTGPIPPAEREVRSPVALGRLIRAHLILMHGTSDEVVACAHSERLALRLHDTAVSYAYHRIESGDHDFAGGPSGLDSRAAATERLAGAMLAEHERMWTEPALPYDVVLSRNWRVHYDDNGLPSLHKVIP